MRQSDNVHRALPLTALAVFLGSAVSCDRASHAEKAEVASEVTSPSACFHPSPATATVTAIFPSAQRMALIPQSSPVTIEAKDAPLGEVLRKVSAQAGWPVERQAPGIREKDFPVTMDLKKAPLLHVLGEMCARNRWSIDELQDGRGGRSMQVETHNVQTPIRAYQVHGPLLLTWHGLCTTVQHNFDDPQHPTQVVRYRLGYFTDPRACLDVGDGSQAPREIPVTFIIDGKEVVLRSDHRPGVFESGVPAWEFEPAKLAGKRVGVRLKLPFLAPARVASAKLPFKNGAEATEEAVKVTLSQTGNEETSAPDPKDPFKWVKVRQWTVQAGMIHSQAGSGSLEYSRMVLRAREAHAFGRDGKKVAGQVTTADGLSSPVHGYRYILTFRSPEPAFEPTSVEVQWAMDYELMEQSFEIPELPLDA